MKGNRSRSKILKDNQRQQKETNTCAMHALNNVIARDLFTVKDFAKVSGHSKGWWSTWDIIEVCNSVAGKRDDWEYYTPGDNPTFSEEKFESLLARQIARNDDANDRITATLCGFVKNNDNCHFTALRLAEDGKYLKIDSLGPSRKEITREEFLAELGNGSLEKSGSMPIWRVSGPQYRMRGVKSCLNHKRDSSRVFNRVRIELSQNQVDAGTVRQMHVAAKPWRLHAEKDAWEEYQNYGGIKWTVHRAESGGEWSSRRVMLRRFGVILMYQPRKGEEVAVRAVDCVGDSATRTPGDLIFDKYVLSRPASKWFGTVGEENMRVWEEPWTTGTLNYTGYPGLDRFLRGKET